MKATRPTARRSVASFFVAIATIAAAGDRLACGSVWIGGNSVNWSDPLNWNGPVPTNGDSVGFAVDASVPPHIHQDLPDGVLVSDFLSGEFNAPPGANFLIDGNRIDLGVGGSVFFEAGPAGAWVVYQAPLRLLGAATLERAGQVPYATSGTQIFHDISGNGSITSVGLQTLWSDHVILNASYTGTTTVQSGILRLGGAVPGTFSLVPANTVNQGDYLVMSGTTLTGMGTIGLASGGKVTVAGNLQPGTGTGLGLGEDGGVDMTINGDLVIADGGRYTASFLTQMSKVIVNGTLDLSAAGERLGLQGPFNFLTPGTYVVMEYQNRLGSFDRLPSLYVTNVTYTSPENSGPGQVLMTVVPEPAASAACVLVVMLGTLRARKRGGR